MLAALALVMWKEIMSASQHLYSEALSAFRMNVDLLGLGRSSGCLIFAGAYQLFFSGGVGNDA